MDTGPRLNGKHDVWTHRLTVCGLVLTVLGTVALSGLLALQGRQLPEGTLAIGSGALGALAALLTAVMKGETRSP